MEGSIIIRLEVANTEIKAKLEKVISSVEGFHIQQSTQTKSPSPCDILILEIGSDTKKDFNYIDSLMTSGTASEIYLTSPYLDQNIMIRALNSGVKGFFTQPIKEKEILTALIRYKDSNKKARSEKDQIEKKGKIISVIGSKGGTGATTIATNLAVNLNELTGSKGSVALIDMNLIFGEVPLFLDIEAKFDWGEVLKNIARVDTTYLMSIFCRHSSGVYVLPAPNEHNGTGEMPTSIDIEKLLELMKSTFNFIIIDSGQSFDNIALKILKMSDIVFLISLLTFPGLINIKKILNTFKVLGYPDEEKIKIVINRHLKNAVISPKEAEKSIERKLFWLIPNDFYSTDSAINQGKPLSATAEKSEISKNLMKLAATFLETDTPNNPNKDNKYTVRNFINRNIRNNT